MHSHSPRLCAGVLVHALLASLPLAQTCAPNQTLLKNDRHPAVLGGSYQIGIVQGLCDNEAAMSVFTTTGPVQITDVGIVYANQFGTGGVQAVVDVEIYDGATLLSNGKWSLGPLVFQLSQGGSNLQVQSTGLNMYTLPQPVRCSSGKAVVGFRMLLNLATGSCASGYTSNFACDADNKCTQGINVLDAIGHGPIDPNKYLGFGVPLCPIYFRGSWMIRACATPDISTTWTGNATPGGFISLTFNSPGQGTYDYLALVSGGISTGLQTPWGFLPHDGDALFFCFLDACRTAMLLGGQGQLNAQGMAFGAIAIPNLPILQNSGLTMYAGFVTFRLPSLNFLGVSTPSQPIVIN